jgi:hypothetical protein
MGFMAVFLVMHGEEDSMARLSSICVVLRDASADRAMRDSALNPLIERFGSAVCTMVQ